MALQIDYASLVESQPGFESVLNVMKTAGCLGTGPLRVPASFNAADGVYFNKATNTFVVYKSGVTLDGVDFRGATVLVQANDVTLSNCRFDASAGTSAVVGYPGFSGLTVDRSTFDGLGLDKTYYDFIVAQGVNTTITNSVFRDAPSDAIYIENGRVAGNYIAGGGYQSGAHADAIWIGKTTGAVIIEDNLIDWRSSAGAKVETNEAIRITAEKGDVSNVQIDGNILLGGSYTVSVTDSAHDKGSVSNVSVTNNFIDGGKYGALYFNDRPGDLVYSGNVTGSGRQSFGDEAVGPSAAVIAAGAKTLIGDAKANAILGTAGRDHIVAGGGQDWIAAGSGDDVIVGGTGRDFVYGGAGKDVFAFASRDDGCDLIMDFTHGEDRVHLSALTGAATKASDWSWLDDGRFTGHALEVRAGSSASGSTVVQIDLDGDMRSDFELEFVGRHDFSKADFILAQSGGSVTQPIVKPVYNEIGGGAGADVVNGTEAADRVQTAAGADSIKTRGGDDVIVGGEGKDIIFSGEGKDTVVLTNAADSLTWARDYIGDFVVGSDKIDVSAIDAASATLANDAFLWIGAAAFSGKGGELRFSQGATSALIQGDLNGDKIADFAIELAGKISLTSSDFIL